jgi:ribosome-binding protein aMBF1 (putative translation factor)
MIRNQRQYKITKAQAANFARELAEFDERPAAHPRVQPRLIKLMKEALAVQLAELQEEIKEYEQLQRSKKPRLKLEQVKELPQTLIRARISSGLSQRELAARLGLKEQQIQRYEATNYETASLRRVMEVAAALTAQTS